MVKYIYSVGMHKEGGLNVLNKFIFDNNEEIYYFLDERLKNKYNLKNSSFVSKFLVLRLIHILYLSFKLKKNDHLIFLNGLPPIFKFKCNISVVFQNANLFREFYNISFTKWLFSKDSLRFLFFYFGKKNVNSWYVFSPTARNMLNKHIKKYINVKVINIYNEYKDIVSLNKTSEAEYDFIYPASFMEHKNHKMLINILILLSKKKIFPKVLFTLDPNDIKKINIEELKNKYGIKLYNYYESNQKKFIEIYKKFKSLLYISLNETIGLPIIEANKYGLFIIAPELEYSKQFINPDITFDINSEKELSLIIENCLKNNFDIEKKSKEIIILKNSITIDDFMWKVI